MARPLRQLAAVLFACFALSALLPPRAEASAAGQKIAGTVFNQYIADNGTRVREPVEGVRVLVKSLDGVIVGEAVTGADGSYEVPLERPGNYVLELDESSLPDGIEPPSPNARQLEVRPNQTKVGTYFLGGDIRDTKSRWSILPQTLLNGLTLAAVIGVCSIGLSLIYGTTGLANFAHGEIVSLGAIVTWVMNQKAHVTLFLAAPFGIAAAAVAGMAMERGLWRPLRRRSSSLTSMMIVSIGIALGVRYVYQFYFGARNRPFAQYSVPRERDFGPFSITPRTAVVILLAVIALVGVALFLLKTRFGKAIRAVSDNPSLASATGIDTDRVLLWVWGIGGGLAGLGGVLFGAQTGVQWDMGFILLLLMFAAITLGGLGDPFGALVGSLVIGVFVELWTWVFPNVVELKTVGALAALIVLLLIRPQGLLGRRERVG